MSTIERSDSASNKGDGFLELPAEMRIQAYRHIFNASTLRYTELGQACGADTRSILPAYSGLPERAPTSHGLADYAGLILSCKQLKAEIENEWVKACNTLINKVAAIEPLRIAPVMRLRDSAHICIRVERPMRATGPLRKPFRLACSSA